MSKYLVVRYVHSTGMPAPEGGWVDDINLARRHALAKSTEKPDDWIRVEANDGEVIDSYSKGSKVEPYIARPRGQGGGAPE
jgi:hypothetical protein